jgi:hypothetical protein
LLFSCCWVLSVLSLSSMVTNCQICGSQWF